MLGEKILKAAVKCPELLHTLTLSQLQKHDLLLAFNILSQHKPSPPLFYTQFCYSFLHSNPHFSKSSLILKDINYSSLKSSISSIISNYFKLQMRNIIFFNIEESIQLLESTTELCKCEIYENTAKWIVEEISDNIIRDEKFLGVEDSVKVLRAVWDGGNEIGVKTLREMCKVRIYKNFDKVEGKLEFYKRDDEFWNAYKEFKSNKS
ncbi:hypothetical protein SteCoe_35418 [Stentor coeruleus]|uniref:Uncharacterized protein n=1 Tax=Stentor coeruleus TaxID=5963 RepID=A0A1R2ASB5_9CILI|nr:hypothetical protein SteCoe_35418 [Stentor coeruleus]